MDRLWSPWRSQYIASFSTTPKSGAERCFLCDAAQGISLPSDTTIDAHLNDPMHHARVSSVETQSTLGPELIDATNLVVHRGQACFVIMNRFPYNAGHLMVVPYAHVGDFAQLAPEVSAELMHTIQLCHTVLTKLYLPHGFNIGANLGRVAGAGVPDHIHFHIVPRWSGDTNFMPVLADIRVASESLETSHDEIRAMFRRLLEQV